MARWFTVHNESGDVREIAPDRAEWYARLSHGATAEAAMAAGRFSCGSVTLSTLEKLLADESVGLSVRGAR